MTMVVDLEDCPCMDSTFMGTLTGIAKQALKNGKLQLVNVSGRNSQLLRNLGLDQILDVDLNDSSWIEERKLVRENITRQVDAVPLSKEERSEMVLEAHESLWEANQNNISKFRDVIDYLKQDLAGAKVNGESRAGSSAS